MIPGVGVEEHLAVHLRTLSLDVDAVALDWSVAKSHVDFRAFGVCAKECLVVALSNSSFQLVFVDVELNGPFWQVDSLVELNFAEVVR